MYSHQSMKELVKALKATRRRRGEGRQMLSQRRAAEELGVTRLTYGMWEKGIWKPSNEHLQLIADWTEEPLPKVLGWVGLLTPKQVRTLLDSPGRLLNVA